MTTLDGAGSVAGFSTAFSDAVVRRGVALRFDGLTSAAAEAGAIQLTSATFQGDSRFDWEAYASASGAFVGTSDAHSMGYIVRTAAAAFTGEASFLHSTPLVVQGLSFFSVAALVEHHAPPVQAARLEPKTLRWLQPLQRGDLAINVSEGRSPIIPHHITYRLLQLRDDGSRKPVGPQERVPVSGVIGEFYATGRAGESGQPGSWLIEWSVQRRAGARVEVTEIPFQVVDAVAVDDPRDRLVRKAKLGWN